MSISCISSERGRSDCIEPLSSSSSYLFPLLWCTDLAGLLSVAAVGDVKEDFQYLDDTLRGFQGDGTFRRLQGTLVLLLPLHLQAALQGRCEDGQPALLEETHKDEWESRTRFLSVLEHSGGGGDCYGGYDLAASQPAGVRYLLEPSSELGPQSSDEEHEA